MAARTFSEAWGRVALQVPSAPVSLVQAWVQDAYDDLAGKRHWAWLKASAILSTLAQRTVSVTFTAASTAITSAAGFVVATDPGRQLRVGSGTPIYTIDTVADTSNATLTQAYAGDTGAASAVIHDRYLVMPADFRSIYTVTDPANQRPVVWWLSQDYLDQQDPARIVGDSRLRGLASYQLSEATATLGRILYEAWPGPTAAGVYLLEYFKRSDVLADDDLFKGVLATKVEAIIDGALARAARWPGLEGRKNPYFSLPLANMHEQRFLSAAQTLNIMDDDQYLESLQQTQGVDFGLGSTNLLRQSDATIHDYL
jgi:hypothetical protein